MPVARGPKGIRQEMHKFKAGKLHSGSKSGPVVTNPKQAIAIALSEQRMMGANHGPMTARQAGRMVAARRRKRGKM